MKEIHDRLKRYDGVDLKKELSTYDQLRSFSARFYADVAEIYDSITRLRNIDRNPTGFSLNDAPILGLLVRIWKLLKEIVVYYEKNNADIIGFLERPLVESAVVAKYLLLNQDSAIEDYRKCSYKDRLRVLSEASTNSPFFLSPPGKRLLSSIKSKLKFEALSEDSFAEQKKNRWKLGGKSFYQIFAENEPPEFYKFLYGIPSESIHGSWNDSMDHHLVRNEDGTFSTYPHYQQADIRFVTPLLRLCDDPYRLWLRRIQAENEFITESLDWIRLMNGRLFQAFEAAYAARAL